MKIHLDGAFNVRDLGGLATNSGGRTRLGFLYRSDALHSLSTESARRLFRQLRVGTVVDLRTREEVLLDPPPLHSENSAVVHNISLIPEGRIGREPFPDGSDPVQLAKRYGENLSAGRAAAGHIFKVIICSLEENIPTLFHCAAGRDRTGVTAAVILKLLDVAHGEIIRDFLATNDSLGQIATRLRRNPLYRDDNSTGTEPVLLHRATIEAFLEWIDNDIGGAAGLCELLGINQDMLYGLRRQLTGT
jgi:protein tyrosine/serine phosphatase